MDVTALAHVQDEDVELIIQLLQQDSEEMASAAIGKGKQREGTVSDEQAAFNLFIQELQGAETFFADRRMTRSIQSAIQFDGDALVQSQNEEAMAEHDHNLSVSLSNGGGETAQQNISPPLTLDDELYEKMACIYITGIDDADSDGDTVVGNQPESSSWAASRPGGRTQRKRACEACGDQKHFAELCRAPCRHEYCRECLSHLFRDAMVDESLFPPRCCKQPIPLDMSQLFLDPNVIRQFRQKALEFSTPNRTYCHNSSCGAFIPPSNCANTTATCGNCRAQTCIICKRDEHFGDCQEDEQLQQVIQLAREQGWQRCQNCWGMVELNTGCNHMTCRCGFQFCYICGARWKTCQCEHWEEHRLYDRAAQIDARDHAENDVHAHAHAQAEAEAEAEDEARNQVEVDDAVEEAEINAHETAGEEQLLIPRPLTLAIPEPLPPNLAILDEPPQEIEEQHERDRQRRIHIIAQNLRDNHECGHERWFNRRGPRACEECSDVMPIFIYECRQCHIIACRRCRYHRL